MKTILCAGAIAIWATTAVAHSPLDGTTPANGSIVSEMPVEVLMDFTGDIRLTRITLSHAGSRAINVDLGGQPFLKNLLCPCKIWGRGTMWLSGADLGRMVMPKMARSISL